ncbi:MAG: hypothetical protein OJF50_006627 [Nitrospira sp.]|jgi:hypothetical protein|nr:hypothetical protein [Nitrospira sp.]
MLPEPFIPIMKAEEPMAFIGSAYVTVGDDTLTAKTEEWIHVAPARFGEGRPCSFGGPTRWTGNSYRYDLFRHSSQPWWGLRWSHADTGWLIEQDRSTSHVQSLLAHVATLPDESQRWDFCHVLAQAIEKTGLHAKEQEAERWKTAFVNKHIRVRRRQGRKEVRILQPWELTR